MTELTYISDDQLIADAAQALLESHLRWSGSNEGMPSADRDYVQGAVIMAYRKATVSTEEWRGMSEEQQTFVNARANLLFVKAATLADRKWEAAMTLLGIEQ